MRRSLLVACAVLGLATSAHAGTLTVTFDTTAKGGNYQPANVVAVWIVDGTNQFIKTIGRWAGVRRSSLVAWTGASGIGDADAVSGATRGNHGTRLTAGWDLKNKAGIEVPDGTYTIRLELADRNSSTPSDNHQGTFTFVKGPTASTQNVSGNGFSNVTIAYVPGPSLCNNGVIDAGETCDPPSSCPTSCASTDPCKPTALVGAASICTAKCEEQPIRLCMAGDSCCPSTCIPSNDADCRPANGGGPGDGGGDGNDAEGGCATGESHAGLLLVLCFGLGVWVMRRRR